MTNQEITTGISVVTALSVAIKCVCRPSSGWPVPLRGSLLAMARVRDAGAATLAGAGADCDNGEGFQNPAIDAEVVPDLLRRCSR